MRISLLLVLLVITQIGKSQTLTILANDGLGIPGVVITDKDRTKGTITDADGRADITQLQNSTIVIRHQAYFGKTLPYSEIAELNFVVTLEENMLEMNEVVVSANRWEQNQKEVPNEIVSLSAKEIEFNNPVTTAEMLMNTGEVFVQKSQLGGGSPMIRGFSANSILLVVDGVRLNNAIYRGGNLQNIIMLDPNSLEGTEVILGPGSAVYGSDALGGVIDFHTKEPALTLDKTKVTGSAMARLNTANNERTGHMDFSVAGKKWSSLTSLTASRIGDLRSGKRNLNDFPSYLLRTQYVERRNNEDVVVNNPEPWYQIGTGYNQLNALQKIRYQLSDQVGFQYSYHLSTSTNIARYDRTNRRSDNNNTTGPLQFGDWYYGPQKWQMHSLTSMLNSRSKIFNEGRITMAYQDYIESRHARRLNSNKLTSNTEFVNMYTLNADFENDEVLPGRLRYGLEGVWNTVDSEGSSTNILTGESEVDSPRYADLENTSGSYAAYATYSHPLTTKLVFNSGLRYTFYQLYSRFSDRFYDFPFSEIKVNTGALSGNAGLVYSPNNWKLSALFSTGFRAPNVDDLTKIFDPSDGVVVPNPGLEPEYTYNLESSAEYRVNNILAISATAYYSILDNAIVQLPFTFNGRDSLEYQGERLPTQALVNASKGYVAGGNLGLRLALHENLLLRSTLTYTWGEEADNGNRLRHIPPLFGQTSLKYRRPKWSAEVVADYQGNVNFEDLPPSEQGKLFIYGPEGTQAWCTLGIRTEYRFTAYLQANAGLENILDRHYRLYSSGLSAPGRNFYLSLRANF
jgi:hemoglobin/transferrin/lactoferrin receptor protein